MDPAVHSYSTPSTKQASRAAAGLLRVTFFACGSELRSASIVLSHSSSRLNDRRALAAEGRETLPIGLNTLLCFHQWIWLEALVLLRRIQEHVSITVQLVCQW